jgi:multidrug efflux pump subunit AcrA (membrane-fusion protein)
MRKRLLLNGFLAFVVVAIAVGAFVTVHSTSGSAATTQTFATAKRGVVLESVTSTGNVEAPTNLSLSFQQSGQVTAIPVAVGDHVGAGQVLAKVDDTQQKVALMSAQASLTSAQASLAALQRGETPIERQADAQSVIAAQQGITTAQQGLTDAQQNATANVTKYDQTITDAKQSLQSATAAVATAQTELNQADGALTTIQTGSDPARSSGESIAATLTRYQLDQVRCANHTGDSSFHPSDGVTCSQIANLLTFANNVQTAQAGLTQAQSQQMTAQSALTGAQLGETTGEMQDQQAIQSAQTQLTSAQNQYNSTILANAVKQEPPKPEQLAQAQAAIVSAQGQLATAEKNESDTILRAPVAGVVALVNGLVGQQSSGSSSSSSSSAASSSSSSASSSSSSGFIQLTNVKVVDVTVGFTETDAPKVHVGQSATITLDALPNQTFTGRVIQLDTDSTLVSNVVTYDAKVSFDTAPEGVKPGMTASVNVVLDKRDDVITLPTSAVSTTGTTETVTVKPKNGSETTRSITIGLRGDNAVEITDGLGVGDQVVITTAASTGTGGFGGGVGGLGGGGVIGGGRGGGRGG